MLLIDNELELRADLTFEDFTKTSLYAGRDMERNGAKFVLGDIGARHQIDGLIGDFLISLLFQDVLKYAMISIVDENRESYAFSEPSRESLETLRDTLIELGYAEASALKVALSSPHYKDSYRLFIEFNDYDPDFAKDHDIWAD